MCKLARSVILSVRSFRMCSCKESIWLPHFFATNQRCGYSSSNTKVSSSWRRKSSTKDREGDNVGSLGIEPWVEDVGLLRIISSFSSKGGTGTRSIEFSTCRCNARNLRFHPLDLTELIS